MSYSFNSLKVRSNIDSEGVVALNIGNVNATSINLGKSGTTLNVEGPLHISEGLSVTGGTITGITVDDIQGLSNVIERKNKLDATVAPATTNDGTEGYSVGSLWVNTITGQTYICVNTTDNAAVWNEISDINGISSLTTDEVTQLGNINSTLISSTQWGYLGTSNQSINTTSTPSFAQLNIDNLRLDGNVISSTDIDGNINILPDGTGQVILKAAPMHNLGAATKGYVDSLVQGLNIKASVRVATTVDLETLAGGVTASGSGVGKTLTRAINSDIATDAIAFDGISLIVGDRVAVVNQGNSGGSNIDNGIYIVTDVGSAGTPWVLTRANDVDGSPSNEVSSGLFTHVYDGLSLKGNGYVLSTNQNPFTVDVDAWVFSIMISQSATTITTLGGISTDNAISRYHLTDGRSIQNSSAYLDDSGNITANDYLSSNGTYSYTKYGTNSLSTGTNAGVNMVVSANNNIMYGKSSGSNVTTGNNNSFMGFSSGTNILTGNNNIGVGVQALQGLVGNSPSDNIAIGNSTMLTANTSAQRNVCVGHLALNNITTGVDNTIIGDHAGEIITTGYDNVIIGRDGDPGSASAVNRVCIGAAATCDADNQITLGNALITKIRPMGEGVADLGDSTYKFKDIYLGGSGNMGSLTITGNSNTNYLKLPELTETTRDTITPSSGMVIYNTTSDEINIRQGSNWNSIAVKGTEVNIDSIVFEETIGTVPRTISNSSAWNSVVWSPELGIFVAVASNSVMTSPDGIYWNVRTPATSNNWTSIAWSPELSIFAAVASTGTGNRIMISADGINWISRTATDNTWNSITWSPELHLFAAVSVGAIMTSSDGMTWTYTVFGTSTWRSITWSPELGIFVAVGNAVVMTSQNGITWTTRAPATSNNWTSIAWSPELGIFAAVSETGTNNHVMTSLDGINWNSRTPADNNNWYSIAWSPELGIFAAVSYTGTRNRLMTSPDGTNWTICATAIDYFWKSIAWSPELGIFAAVTLNGGYVLTTERVPKWTFRTPAANNNWNSIAWSPELGIFAAVSSTGTNNHVMTSLDGITWDSRTPASNNTWNSIAWSPYLSIFAAVGSGAGGDNVMTSTNGITWTLISTAVNFYWYSITWSPELHLFAAVGYSGTVNNVMTSPDGTNWTIRTSASSNTWQSIAWSPELGIFAAVSSTGTGNRVMTSANGINWYSRTTLVDNIWNSIAWSPELGLFAAVGHGTGANNVMISSNGITWYTIALVPNLVYNSITWSSELGIFVAISAITSPNIIMTSSDGINWAVGPTVSTSSDNWKSIAWSPYLGIFAAVGNGTVERVITTTLTNRISEKKIIGTLPTLTTIQQNNITSNIEGSIIYNSSTKKVRYYNGTQWINL